MSMDKSFRWFMGLAVFMVVISLVVAHRFSFVESSLKSLRSDNSLIIDAVGGGEWVCIAESCSEWVEGEAWANHFCSLKNNSLMCEVTIEGDEYVLPIERFNISSMKSCIKKSCVTEVYVRKAMEVDGNV